jgi:predicted Ser/Thr protein kinase
VERKDLLKEISDKLGTSASIPLFEGNQGRLFKIKTDEQAYLIKSANQNNWWSKSINRWSIKHEYKIYEELENLDGIPNCYGLTKDGSLVLEYIDGESYRSKQFELDGNDQFFDSLLELIKSMHDKGIAHGDLKRKDNLLVDKNLSPYLIDFGTALIKNNHSGIFKKIIFNFLQKTDLNAWVKHKYKRSYDKISDKDKGYYSPTFVEKFYRKFIKRI